MITRVTQHMLVGRELSSIGTASTRMSAAQEQMTTGRRINRPSDAPADTTVALKARAGIAQNEQYQRNAQDGTAWLSTIDTTLTNMTSMVRRAYTLAVAGANTATNSQTSENANADEVDQILQSVLGLSNATYLGRPVFGGTTGGDAAYKQVSVTDPSDPTKTISQVQYAGNDGKVERRVGDGTVVRVDSEGSSVFGPTGTVDATGVTTPGDSVFDHLQQLSTALRSSDNVGIQKAIGDLTNDMDRFSSAAANEGARMKQIDTAVSVSQDTTLALQKAKSDVEDVDVAEATITMQSMTAAYQAALMAVGKSTQQSLLDFLR